MPVASNDEWSNEEFDSALASTHCSFTLFWSQDSDSEAEVAT